MSRSIIAGLLSIMFILAFSIGVAAYNEAPPLAQMVEAGKLPPVDERLPDDPLVVQSVEEIGEYGGTWRRAALGPNDVQIQPRLSYETLVRWNEDGSGVVPNVAKEWEVSADGRTFTFHLREGMKWSDGHPFTSEDIEFWWNQFILNKDLNPVPPEWISINGELAEFAAVDSDTIRFEFAEPYGIFLRVLAYRANEGDNMNHFPKHYLKQLHPDFVDLDALNAQAREAGLETWYQLFNNERNPRLNPDLPVIYAWKLTQPPPNVPVVAERNPYYWKVDPEGNQLPYLDRVTHVLVENPEVLNLKAAAGEIDMQLRHILVQNLPVFAQNADRNNFHIFQWKRAEASNFLLYPNMFHEDPVLRELFRNETFRQALSLAIDREEINQLGYLGLGRPRQGGVIPESPFYVEGTDLNYVERDVERANEMLDEIGLGERDSQGFRLRPDGKRLSITLDLAPVFGPWPKVGELVVDYWGDIGIQISLDVMERSLFQERASSGEWDWAVWINDRGLTPDVDPLFLLPGRGQTVESPWFEWFNTQGAQGIAPPEGSDERRAYEIYGEVKTEPDAERQVELMKHLVRLNMENLWYIGTVGEMPHIVIVTDSMHNVPEAAVSDWLQMTPGNTWPEQYFKR